MDPGSWRWTGRPDVLWCQGTFNFKESNLPFSPLCTGSQGPCVPYQFLENRNRAELQAVPRTEVMRQRACVDDLYFIVNYLVTSLLLRIWIIFWPCDDCYSPVSVFAQLYFCCLKLPCMGIYQHTLPQIKHPCFTRDFSSLRPSFRRLQSPDPRL